MIYGKVKVALYNKKLENALGGYSSEFMRIPDGLSLRKDVRKYVLIERPSFIIISQSSHVEEQQDYNIILSVQGKDEEHVKNTLDKVIDKLEIKFKEAPEQLKKIFQVSGEVIESLINQKRS